MWQSLVLLLFLQFPKLQDCLSQLEHQQPPRRAFYLVHLKPSSSMVHLELGLQLIKEQTSCEELEEDFHLEDDVQSQMYPTLLCPANEVEFWLLDNHAIPPFYYLFIVESVVDQTGKLTHFHEGKPIKNRLKPASSTTLDHSTIFERYLSFKEMEDWLKTMVSSSSSKFPLSNMKVIGSSHESRPIYVMEIDFEENSKKPIILVEAGAHAREWIGPAVALALIDRLIYSTNMNDYLRQFRWRILPMLNPDGYDYSWTTNRFWLKNRSPDCGVNLNRNFPAFWRPSHCQFKNYSGPFPMSEPEVQSLVSYVKENLVGQTVLAWSLHCFGQVFFLPYAGSASVDPPHLAQMKSIARKALHYITPHYYRHGKVQDFLSSPHNHHVGGTSMDFYAASGIPFSYTIELPDLGTKGFLLPASEIREVSNGIFIGLTRMAEELLEELEINPDILTMPVNATKDYYDGASTSVKNTTSSTWPTSTAASTTITTTEKLDDCCQLLSLQSNGSAKQAQPDVFGIFHRVENKDSIVYRRQNPRPPQLQQLYLFTLLPPEPEVLVVGPRLFKNFGFLAHTDNSAKCPENIQTDAKNRWFYLSSGEWKSDDLSITLTCIDDS